MAALALLVAPFCAKGSSTTLGDWKIHNTFDEGIYRLFDSPNSFYYLALAQPYSPTVADNSVRQAFLWVLDKESGEMKQYNRRDGLSESVVRHAEYNAARGYLMLIYKDYNIDLLFDDGEVVNIPALVTLNLPSSKEVNSITFDPENNLAYIATDYGYVCINDADGEVHSSRIYNTPLLAVAACGDHLLAVDKDGQLLQTRAGSPHLNYSDFTPVAEVTEQIINLLPLEPGKCAYIWAVKNKSQTLSLVEFGDSFEAAPTVKQLRVIYGFNYQTIGSGRYLITASDRILDLKPDGTFDMTAMAKEDCHVPAASINLRDFYMALPRKGYYTKRFDKESGTWTLTADTSRPSAPAPYLASFSGYSPVYGSMVINHGIDNIFSSRVLQNPLLISCLKDGEWIQKGIPYIAPEQNKAFANPYSFVFDPDNDRVAYFGSMYHGLLRMNLDNPDDILHIARSDDAWKDLPGFVEDADVMQKWKSLCCFSTPAFDSNGTLWTTFLNFDNDDAPIELRCWTPEKRKASTSPVTYRPMTRIPLRGTPSSNYNQLYTLKHANNQNMLVLLVDSYGEYPIIYHTGGTAEATGDDRRSQIKNAYDQDGQPVNANHSYCGLEDPETGLVWIGSDNGVYTFDPRNAIAGSSQVNRVKVARNDGTQLADYLLNGVRVNHISIDDKGRKWFSTSGAGLVCTSADGKEVIMELTSGNSWLPDDEVYSANFNPETHSLIVTTAQGIAEYFPFGRGNGEDFEMARAYPNPVRPDYYGYVTIDGLADNSIVKITDSAGNIVRELGFAQGGTVQWDCANMEKRRVKSGVYYVLASTGPDDDSLSMVSKILVMN